MRILPTARLLKRLFIGAALLIAFLLIVNGTLAWQANQRLENKRAEVRAAGMPASIADLAPRPIADEKNAAAYLERIRPQLDAFHKDYNALCNSPIGDAYFVRVDAGQLPTPEQAQAVNAILLTHGELLTAFRRMTACDVYASKLDFSLPHRQFLESVINRQQIVRAMARYVDLQAKQAIAEGHANEAVQLGTQLLKLGRLSANEPTLVSHIVSIAIRNTAIDQILNGAIRAGSANDSILDGTRAVLLAELNANDRPALKNAMRTEWALVLDFPAEGLPGLPILNGLSISDWVLGEAGALEEAIVIADRPYFELRDKWGPAQNGKPGQPLILSAIRGAIQAEARRLTLERCLRILAALTAFKQRTGHEASGLDDLSLPAADVIDPYSGKPLLLKWTDDGWVVYSVMENGVDDGGDFTNPNLPDFGLAPPGWKNSN